MAKNKKLVIEEEVQDGDEVVLEVENNEDESTVDESSAAASTLAPGAGSVEGIEPSRMQSIASVMGSLAQVDKSTLQYFDKMISQSIENSKGAGIGDNAKSTNQGSLETHPSDAVGTTKEEIEKEVGELLSGSEGLTEDFKKSAAVLFEAALNARVNVEISRLEDEYEARFDEELKTVSEELEAKVQKYMEYTAQEWMDNNEVAIESALRNEITSEFMTKLRELFIESNINIPEDQVEVVDALAEKVDELETRLAEAITENAELKTFKESSTRKEIVDDAAKGMTLAASEKFKAMAEAVEADTDDEFKAKVAVIKENVAPTKKKSTVENLLEEVDEENTPVDDSNAHVDPKMKRYLAAMDRVAGTV